MRSWPTCKAASATSMSIPPRTEAARCAAADAIAPRRADADEELSGQPARSGARIASEAALEGFDRGVAKNRADDDPAARPDAFGRGLIAARRARSDAAQRVGRAVGGFERAKNRARRRRGDAVALPLELDPLQPAR